MKRTYKKWSDDQKYDVLMLSRSEFLNKYPDIKYEVFVRQRSLLRKKYKENYFPNYV